MQCYILCIFYHIYNIAISGRVQIHYFKIAPQSER